MIITKVEYCESTWNPISGCRNTCEYCYARRIAERFKGCEASPDGTCETDLVYLTERQHFVDSKGGRRPAAYPFGFTPTFHEYRLKDLTSKGLGKTIFVCSMADMFAPWIPDEWIEKIFNTCLEAPNHRYLFLTKYPERYRQLSLNGMLPSGNNFWYGSTMDKPDKPAFWAEEHNTFVSVEPVLEPFDRPDDPEDHIGVHCDWLILGAETGPRSDRVVPERSWVEGLVEEFTSRGKPVFMKNSMKPVWGEDILTEFPWDD